jgi:hypothetical protein
VSSDFQYAAGRIYLSRFLLGEIDERRQYAMLVPLTQQASNGHSGRKELNGRGELFTLWALENLNPMHESTSHYGRNLVCNS